MSKPLRLDAELVRRGLAASRTDAKRAIEDGRVLVGGFVVTKAATLVKPDASVAIDETHGRFASRGGIKLDGALERLDVTVAGRSWLDVGASTGGFTDRLLQGGASAVIALDVGYGQLAWELRTDDRVVVLERTNARNLKATDLPFVPQGVVADVSFISLTLVLPAIVPLAEADADHVLLVKPQFEAGRDAVMRGGVVRDPQEWIAAMDRVVSSGGDLGLGLAGATPSALPGPAGNREFFVHLKRGAAGDRGLLETAAAEAPA